MANLTEKQVWETGIYQLETTDPVEGGANGKSNQQGKQLANRTSWLKKQVDDLVGTLIIWPTSTPPAGYLECDGAALSRTTYAALYAVLGTTYGKGAGTAANTTFRLPDLRGEFIRGWDHGRGIDPDRAARTDRGDGTTGDQVGSRQAGGVKKHHHIGLYNSPYGTGFHYQYGYKHNGVNTHANNGLGAFPHLDLGLHDNIEANAIKTGDVGGKETRPRNIGMMFAIKY